MTGAGPAEPIGPGLLEAAEEISGQLIAWRREFHQFPELAFEENVTSARIVETLSSIEGIEVVKGFGCPTSVVAVIGADLPGKSLMIRAEMDALALDEETGVPFSSCIPGVMHAAGHDAHMASLLGAAVLIAERRAELAGPVALLFQPAEEGKGGARTLVQAGLMNRFNVGQVVAPLLWPKSPYGTFMTRPAVITALSDRIHVEIRGVGGHAALPHVTVDPILIGAHIVLAVQSLISRELDPLESAVISFGQVEAGEAYNIIPETGHMWGTLRAFDTRVRDFLRGRLESLVPAVATAFRGSAVLDYTQNYPQTQNDASLTKAILECAEDFFGNEQVRTLDRPLLSGEDFSFYSLEVPSCLMLIGTGEDVGLHHSRYQVPEEALPLVAAWETYMALSLTRGEDRSVL
ncbi:MAG: M20 family metallopeptidase [Synergistales bacterium]